MAWAGRLPQLAPSEYARQRSVKSHLGGYGLYYRSPMEELGVIVRRGQGLVGEEPNPIDLLRKNDRAQALADHYEAAVADTRWYRDWMHGVDPVPAEVLEELGQVGCLCRLDEHGAERDAIAAVLLSAPSAERAEASEQRRRAFALVLDLAAEHPDVVYSDASFREAVLSRFIADPRADDAAGQARARWAAAVMRESAQDPLAAVWTSFCRAGMAAQPFDGLTRSELEQVIRERLIGSSEVVFSGTTIPCTPDTPCETWLESLIHATSDMSWEEIRETAANAGDAVNGLAGFLLLCARVPDRDDVTQAWSDVARVDGDRQPGLAGMATHVNRRLAAGPTVSQMLAWTIDNFIVSVHETVAMGKLPNSTFRFFWEHGRLRFVDNGVWRFEMSGLRRDALASLAYDLGWWTWYEGDEEPVVTDGGHAVVAEVFGR